MIKFETRRYETGVEVDTFLNQLMNDKNIISVEIVGYSACPYQCGGGFLFITVKINSKKI